MQNLSIIPQDNIVFSVDMVKVEVKNVKVYEWNKFLNHTEFMRERLWISDKITDYHYNIVFLDDTLYVSDSTVFMGYEHNAKVARDVNGQKDLIIRFNPAKLNPKGALFHHLRELIIMSGSKVLVKEMDLAFDLPYRMADVYLWSNTGKEKSMYKGTEYFGGRHTDGYAKKYDKAKEQGRKDTLTRFEVTLKDSVNDIELLNLLFIKPAIDKFYTVNVLRSLVNTRGDKNLNLKAIALCVINEHMSLDDLPVRRKSQVKEYIKSNYVTLKFDPVIVENWENQIQKVKSFLFEKDFS